MENFFFHTAVRKNNFFLGGYDSSFFSSDFNTKNLIVIRKNQNIAKKHSVVIIVRTNCEKKWFSCNLKFFPSYLGWKKGISKTFRSLGFASTSKTFFLMHFFNLGNLEKTSNYTWTIFSHSLSEQLWQQNTISCCPFFKLGNLEKSQITLEKNFLTVCQNEICTYYMRCVCGA